jgi:hypothetical protein
MMDTRQQSAKDAPPLRPPPAPNGTQLPTVGRPKGTANRVTRSIREAVEIAARDCHPRGLAGWLVERAQGGVQDRQIFASLVAKALPLQVHAQVGGGIRLELGWLNGRQVGTPAAQIQQQPQQVIDLQPEQDGMYRIVDPAQQEQQVPVASEAPQGAADAGSTMHTNPPAPSA